MELNESIRSHAYRRLNTLKSFQSGDHAASNLPAQIQTAFTSDEELFGIYVNSEIDSQANLVFTTRGIYRFAESWSCIEYAKIVNVTAFRDAHFNLQTADTLMLHDDRGQEIKLVISGAIIKTISGNQRRFSDLYKVFHYLDRVIERVKSG